MNKIKVLVNDLQPGMFVCELDRPWLDTPFLLQGILIQSSQEIEELRRYCEYVYVDPEKTSMDVRARLAPGDADLGMGDVAHSGHAKRNFCPNPVVYRDTTPVEKELATARKVRAAVGELVRSVEQDIRGDRPLDQLRFKEAVATMVDSIIRNPDALFLLTRIKETDAETYGRSIDVAIYVLTFARHLGFPKEDMQALGTGGLLMDVGKTKLPPAVLGKRIPLNGEEHKLMKTHVLRSSEILAKSQWIPPPILDMVLTHHEREDGSGYPRGLRGAQIGIYGKIAGIADCYEDLISPQPFAPPLAPSAALKMLMELKGRIFHDDLVEEFVQCIGVYPVGSLVELNTGEVAIVMANNRIHRLKPQVMVILDPKKKPYDDPKMIDLDESQQAGSGFWGVVRGLEQGAFGIDPKEYYL